MAIYTSRFGNKELDSGKYTVVGIVRSMPRYRTKYRIAGNILQIAPPWSLWREDDREKFTEPYYRHLEKSGYQVIADAINRYVTDERDLVLCCYEDVRKPGEWCHRLVFAEWWLEKTGQKIEELPDPSPAAKTQKPKENPQAVREKPEEEPQYEQMTLNLD